MADTLLPLKVVIARKDTDYRVDPSQGGSKKVFEPVTQAIRAKFVSQVASLQSAFVDEFKAYPSIPAVAKIELRSEAIAKSHRPTLIFNPDTCPIIGVDHPGELLVSVSPDGLNSLSRELMQGSSKTHIANISTLKALLPFRSEDALVGEPVEKVVKEAKRRNLPLRVRLFQHESDSVNSRIDKEARAIAAACDAKMELISYGPGIRAFALHNVTPKAVQAMARFVGTQNISQFPDFKIVRTTAHVMGPIDENRFPKVDPKSDYGLVGVIDSGTDPNNQRLQEYVVTRDEWVKSRQDNGHGSFVGGLIANSRALNGGNHIFPTARSKIIDVVAIDSTGLIAEYDLITVIDHAVKTYPNVRVWNLSLGQSVPCSDKKFSLLACKLDSIAKKNRVLFVVAAGNYETPPFRSWPPNDLGEEDRICPPADSVRSLTVGSLAHLSHPSTVVAVNDPSGFTRRGPAPHFYIKPEVSHYGGNCTEQGDCLQCGVVSIDGKGNLAENIGTSFAAPCISTIAANVFRELEPEGEITPAFVKGLIVHSAFVRTDSCSVQDVRYRGFGSPGDVSDILNCSQSSATIIFHAELSDRQLFEKHDFPIPNCLLSPKLRAEMFMTLVYDPPTDARYGIEYCRTNITASLGTVVKSKDGKERLVRQLDPSPKKLTDGCEKNLIAEGFKWSPIKFYHRSFIAGPSDRKWRLHLEILNRDGFRCSEPQKLILFLTIRDPSGKGQVYNEMVKEMDRLAWGAADLKVASRTRIKRGRI